MTEANDRCEAKRNAIEKREALEPSAFLRASDSITVWRCAKCDGTKFLVCDDETVVCASCRGVYELSAIFKRVS